MNTEIKQLWLEELRSGRHIQGRGRLRNYEGGMCCLGVLCSIHADMGLGYWDGLIYVSNNGDDSPHVLPESVVLWAGLARKEPLVGEGLPTSIAAYNDGDGLLDIRQHDFLEIADLIERYL